MEKIITRSAQMKKKTYKQNNKKKTEKNDVYIQITLNQSMRLPFTALME